MNAANNHDPPPRKKRLTTTTIIFKGDFSIMANNNQIVKHTLYIGLNDKETKTQKIDTVEAYKIAENILINTCGGATIYNAMGIYRHENGETVIENSLRVEIWGCTDDQVMNAAMLLKTALNQETIGYQTETVISKFI